MKKKPSQIKSKAHQKRLSEQTEVIHHRSLKPLNSWIVVLFISCVTILFYLPSLRNGFVNWDDPMGIIENYSIRFLNLSFFKWMFTTFLTGNWIPLTWLSFALDYSVGKLNATVYHAHNLLLHVINTGLVFFLSVKILKLAAKSDATIKEDLYSFSGKMIGIGSLTMTPMIWASALTTLLFGLHPIHVESVAWITERKDLLFSLFFFASLLVYLNNLSNEKQATWKWIACWLLFALSLLSKPMAVTLPLILLLLDAWPLKRFHSNISRILWEKIPFFLLSFAISVVTIAAQSHAGAVLNTEILPLDFRIMNAFHSIVFYIWKMVIPVNLVPFYPIKQEPFNAENLFAVIIVFMISLICYVYREKKPYLWMSWLFYLVTLAPVIGILQVGAQAAADRYTYLPLLSLFLLFSTSLVIFFSHHRKGLITCTVILVCSLGFATVNQMAIWKNSITLWKSVVGVYPDQSIIIHTNMGNAYKQFNQLDDALKEYNRALAIHPHSLIYDGRGIVLLEKGFVDEAIQDFHHSIALDPTSASPHRNLWFAYDKKGLQDLALSEILEAVKINPEYAEAYNNLGISLGRKGDFSKSIDAFETALSLDPENSKYLINLATTYQRNGQLDLAIDWYKKGLQLHAKDPIYFLNLANTYVTKGMFTDAIQTLLRATQLQPPQAEIFKKLGIIYEKTGQMELAQHNYEIAQRINRRE